MRAKPWKHLAIILVLAGAAVIGGARIRASAESAHPSPYRRIETITLDPGTCKLSWTVTRGEVKNGEFVSKGSPETYEIAFHSAEMTHNGVTRKFSEEEAVSVHQVMVMISRYAAESVDWFEQQDKPLERASR